MLQFKGLLLIPGPHQGPFIVACAAASRGANKLKVDDSIHNFNKYGEIIKDFFTNYSWD
jgi:hypothetical protein